MARCPAGHESQASDYCDTCGLVIGGESAAAAASPLAATLASSAPMPSAGVGGAAGAGAGGSAGGGGCPVCQAERNGRFCEECGYDFDLAEAMPQATMTPGVPAQPGPAAAESGANAGSATSGEQGGLDLDAELARAEAEAARAVAEPAAPAVAAEPESEPSANQGSATAAAALAEPGFAPEAGESSPSAQSPAPVAFAVPASSALLPGEELTLVVDADQAYYAAQVERGDIIEAEFPFPKYPHERRFTFAEGPVRIGRVSSSRGLNPEIDLTGPPLDPAVSHLHAQLLRHDEGWVVVDLGSANGTRLNDAEEPLEAETEIPVKPGDRIHLGVWTTITVQ